MRRTSSAPDVNTSKAVADERTFYNLLVNFNRRQRRFYTSLPTFCGVTLKLYSLFSAVVKRGGYSKVTENDLWESVSREIGCPSACANLRVALRRVYCQYLVAFENESYPQLKSTSLWSQFQDEFHENSGDVFFPPSVEKMLGIFNPKPSSIHYGMQRSATHLGFVSKDFFSTLPYNQNTRFHSFDQLPPSQQLEELHSRPHPSNSFDLLPSSILATAEKSLMSGLPNEVDLSLNSVLFLSAVVHSSPATPLRLSSSRYLLQLMLATVGIFEDGASSLRPLSQAWNSTSNFNFDKFWRDAVGDHIVLSLLEDAYLLKEHSEPLMQDAETAGYRVAPPSPDTTYDLFAPSPSHARQFFGPIGGDASSGCGSDNDAPLSRILTVVTTLVNCITPPHLTGLPPSLEEDDDEIEQVMAFASVKNQSTVSIVQGVNETSGRPIRGRSLFYAPGLVPPLSTWRENVRFLSSHPCALRFAFLCAYARHSALRQLGLQLISGLRYPLNSTTFISVAKSATTNLRVPRSLHLNTFTGIELISVRFLVRCLLQSADRCDLLAGLNLLTNLLRVPEGVNIECLFAGLPRFLWYRLIQLLCLSDLGLVCAVLEALYTATGMGSLACTRLWGVLAFADDNVSERAPATVFAARRASIHLRPLLALLSIEGQSMGPGSLYRVKVMQRHPQPLLTPPMPLPAPPTSQTMMRSSVMHHPQPLYPQHHSHHHHPLPAAEHPPQYFHQQALRCLSPLQPTSGSHLAPQFPILPSRQRPSVSASPHPASSSLASLLSLGSAPPSTTSTVSRGLPMPPQTPKVNPEANSLSELTDRLQMPPPQMPPPRRTSSRVIGAPVSSIINRSPSVIGKTASLLTNSISDRRLSQCHQHLPTPKLSSKSFLKEVLNAPSSKAMPSLVNGCGDHIASEKNRLLVAAAASIKLVNGVSDSRENRKKKVPLRTRFPLVNGVKETDSPEGGDKLKKGVVRQIEEDRMEDEEELEAKLLEVATFFTHYLCFNRRVGFHYTRKRLRDFALRNRVLSDDTISSSSSCFSTKRCKVDSNNNFNKTASSSSQRQTPSPQSPPSMFVCGWRGCLQRFPVAKQFFSHVYQSHLKPSLPSASPGAATSSSIQRRRCCQWNNCSSDHLPRAPYALMSHVLEQHCSSSELESLPQSIPPLSSAAVSPISSPSSYPVAMGLSDPSGWAIIKEVEARRLQSDFLSQCAIWGRYYSANTVCSGNSEGGGGRGGGGGRMMQPPPREGPVTKHLRVTAALILRNLAKHIPEARRWLLSETPLLCEIAMGTCPGASSPQTNDASRIIAQCLSICTSHHLHLQDGRRGPVDLWSDKVLDDCSYYCCDDYHCQDVEDDDDDDFRNDECTGDRLSLPRRLAVLRQRSSVDLDA